MTTNEVNKSREEFERLQEQWQKLLRPIRILVVEDDIRDVELLKKQLEGINAEIKSAFTGSESIQWMGQEDYDICLLDLKLADMPGCDVIRWAKEHQKSVPFVVLTGLDDFSPMIKEALTAGAECAFQKPLTPENVNMIFGGL